MTGRRSVTPWFTALALGGAWLWGASSALAGLPTFNTIEIGFGNGPAATVAADFSGDGKADLAVANADGSSVSIFINGGTGLGLTPSQTLTGTPSNPLKSPQGIATGDFNNDGKLDLAVTNYSGSSVSIFMNNGSGSFTGPTNTAVSANPLGIAVGKFRTASSNFDLAIVAKAGSTSGQVILLLGNGNGTFSVQTPIVVGKSPKRLAIGDFGSAAVPVTQDGKSDVVVSLYGEAAVALLYGDGVGGLGAPVKFGTDIGPQGIAVGDFNNDTCLDVATANHNGSAANTVDVLIGCDAVNNKSFGGAQQVATLGSGANTTGVATVELNGDSKIDIVAIDTGASGTGNDRAVLLQNNIDLVTAPRSARFNTPVLCATDDGPSGVAIADFNSDTIADLAVGNRTSDDVSILNGTGSATCSAPTQIGQKPAKKPIAVAACNVTDGVGTGDPDAGGNLDLLVLDQATGSVVIFGGDGNGNFTKGTVVLAPNGETTATSVACAGDQDGNSKDDFTVTYQGSDHTRLFCNQGGTVFGDNTAFATCPPVSQTNLNGPTQVIYADLNGAGAPDVAIVNKSNNTIQPQNLATGTTPLSLTAGRFNTAFNDLAVANNAAKTVGTFTNDGAGNFLANPAQSLGTNAPVWVTAGNVNPALPDTLDDLITANKSQDNISVMISSGGGGFGAHVDYAAGNGPDSVVVADFDVDGKPDVAVADFYTDVVSILPGNGLGSLSSCPTNTASCEYHAGDGPVSLVTAKLNNDTYPDLVVVDQNSGSVSILLNAYTPPPPPPPTPTPCVSCPTPTPGPGC